MGLIYCPECGNQVSNQAEKCIKCGFPLQKYLYDKHSKEYIANKQKEFARCNKCGFQNKEYSKNCCKCNNKLPGYFLTVEEYQHNNINTIEIFHCKKCGTQNRIGYEMCYVCNNRLLAKKEQPKKQKPKSGVYCPKCYSTQFQVVGTDKKFSLGKAIVGNTVGAAFGNVPLAIAGTMTGVGGKKGRTKFVCNNCGNVWEKQL